MIFDVNRMWLKNGDYHPGLEHVLSLLIDKVGWVHSPQPFLWYLQPLTSV